MDEFDQTKKTYNKIAQDYHKKRLDPNSASWNNYLENPAMESILKALVKDKTILDLGCGTGLLTNQINNWGGRVNGIDISDEMIGIAQQSYQNLKFQVSDLNKLPFENNEYDVVASSLVMHYLKDLKPGFHEVSRVLKNNGQFIFSMHHPLNETFSLNKLKENNNPVLQPYFNNNHYYWQMCGAKLLSFHHTFETIIKALKSAGFVLIDLIECRPDPSTAESFADYEFTSQYPTFCLFHACSA